MQTGNSNPWQIIVYIIALYSSSTLAKEFTISNHIHNGSTVPFLAHTGSDKWNNYLAMNLPYQPAAELFKQLQDVSAEKLRNRGEAHITVVTPVEYWNQLKPNGITMPEINAIALKANIQKASFQILCIGRGVLEKQNETAVTYYLVIHAPELLAIRKEIHKLLLSKGTNKSQFVPLNFYPHITIGFSPRDLHESDGIIKNSKSCVFPINEIR